MASNDAYTSAENTLGGACDGAKQYEETLAPLAELLECFLSRNLEFWMQEKKKFLTYNLEACEDLGNENLKLMKSVLVLAYLFRKKIYEMFKRNSKRSISSAETRVLFKYIPDDHYMFHYLVRLACLYETYISVYTLTEKYDKNRGVKACILEDTDGPSFFKQGGLKKLYSTAKNISGFYDALVQSFGVKVPDTDVLTPFSRAVNIVERRYRYKDFAMQVENKMNTEENPKIKEKLQALIFLGVKKFTLGYMTVNRKIREDGGTTSKVASQIKPVSADDDCSSLTLDETNLKGNEEIIESSSSDEHVDTTEDEDTTLKPASEMKNMSVDNDCSSLTLDETNLKGNEEIIESSSSGEHMDTAENEEANTKSGCELEESTFLFFSKTFTQKYIQPEKDTQISNYKSNVNFFCPERIKEVTLFSRKTLVELYDILELYYVSDEIHALGGEDIENPKKDVILMDTSSEEEDELDSYGDSIQRHTIKCFREFSLYDMKKMKFLINEYTKRGDLLNLLFTKMEQIGETTGDTPNLKSPDQRKPVSSTSCTGDIPDVNTDVKMENRTNETTNGQNGALANPHSSTFDVSNVRRLRTRERRYTPDGKREWRKNPVKRI